MMPLGHLHEMKWRLLIALLYAALALTLLAPSASDSVLPSANDLQSHLGAIIQAKLALQEGQFPPRIAPWQHNGWQYPLYQFYSSLPFTLAGLVYLWLTPANPYVAFKLTLWLMLAVAGIFTYRLAAWLTGSRPAGLLAGAAYMAAPYFLINIHARGNFAESFAQGVLPPVLYYSARCFAAPRLRPFVAAAVCWSALATAHVITFVYSSLFIGLWFLLLPGRPGKHLGRLARLGAAYGCGLLLAAYFLAPALSADFLVIRDRFYLPYDSNWLTPLPALLSPVSLPPEPQPGQLTTPNLHPAVGWPMLLGAAVAFYTLVARPATIRRPGASRCMWALLAVFGVGLLTTWSPVDFWSRLPPQLHLVQFPYRLLSQISWSGALLGAYALQALFAGQLDQRHVAVGLFLIGIGSSSWLPSPRPNDKKIADLVREPSLYHGRNDYLISENSHWFTSVGAAGVELPLGEVGADDDALKQDREVDITALMPYRSAPITLHLSGEIPSLPAEQIVRLSALLNGRSIASTQLEAGPFTWDVPLSERMTALARGDVGDTVGLKLVTERVFLRKEMPDRPSKKDRPEVRLRSAVIGGLPAERTALPITSTQQGCTRAGLATTCRVSVPREAGLVQLPVLFYPGLLEAQVDGQTAPYLPLSHRGYVLVGLQLPPGEHRISVRFEGLAWANRVSGVAWLGVAALFAATFVSFAGLRRRALRPARFGTAGG
jgi:hypothetical protein